VGGVGRSYNDDGQRMDRFSDENVRDWTSFGRRQ